MTISRKKFYALLLLLFVAASGLLFFNRVALLEGMGKVLLVQDEIKGPADLIVVVRGGTNFERLLEAFDLYQGDKGKRIVIAKALSDQGNKVLEQFGIQRSTIQGEYKDILMELGVPERDVILDLQKPGGGTYGEALRMRRLASEMGGINSIIVVTSWWHTRKARMMYRKVFEDSGIDIMVHPAMRYPASTPSDWWKYRYQTVAVLQEYFKIIAYFFRGVIGFSDDYPQSVSR